MAMTYKDEKGSKKREVQQPDEASPSWKLIFLRAFHHAFWKHAAYRGVVGIVDEALGEQTARSNDIFHHIESCSQIAFLMHFLEMKSKENRDKRKTDWNNLSHVVSGSTMAT